MKAWLQKQIINNTCAKIEIEVKASSYNIVSADLNIFST